MPKIDDDLLLIAKEVKTGWDGFSIDGINIELTNGDIFGLLGRSGSGKSTIIQTLLGLCRPRLGAITFRMGETETALRAHVGYSPQRNALYPFLTVEENLRTFAQLHGVSKKILDDRITALLERLDLEAHRDKRVTQLSGGMEKRVDLACTLIHDPKIIILDEPFNGLDISLQGFIWELLVELSHEGRIVIISSHFLEDIQKNCTCFGLVENGYWYNDADVRTAMKREKGTLQNFLARLFRRDLEMERQRAKTKPVVARVKK